MHIIKCILLLLYYRYYANLVAFWRRGRISISQFCPALQANTNKHPRPSFNCAPSPPPSLPHPPRCFVYIIRSRLYIASHPVVIRLQPDAVPVLLCKSTILSLTLLVFFFLHFLSFADIFFSPINTM